MKKLVIVAVAIINCFVSLAQSRVEPVEFQKIPRQAAVMEYPFLQKQHKQLFMINLQNWGIKAKKQKALWCTKGFEWQK